MLFRDQKKFDRDGNGRLNFSERKRWYLHKYRFQIEHAEVRRNANARADWRSWLKEAGVPLWNTMEDVCRTAEDILPPMAGRRELALKASLYK